MITTSDYPLDRPEVLAFLFHNNIFMAGLGAYLAAIRRPCFRPAAAAAADRGSTTRRFPSRFDPIRPILLQSGNASALLGPPDPPARRQPCNQSGSAQLDFHHYGNSSHQPIEIGNDPSG